MSSPKVFSHSEAPGVGFLAPRAQGPPKLRWKDSGLGFRPGLNPKGLGFRGLGFTV